MLAYSSASIRNLFGEVKIKNTWDFSSNLDNVEYLAKRKPPVSPSLPERRTCTNVYVMALTTNHSEVMPTSYFRNSIMYLY